MDQRLCTLRGCCWSPQSDTNVPWCFFSSNHGYRVDGGLRKTQEGKLAPKPPQLGARRLPFQYNWPILLYSSLLYSILLISFHFVIISSNICFHFPAQGFQATLTRLSSPSLFGNDINTALLTAEYQTQNRFRFKVSFSNLLSARFWPASPTREMLWGYKGG